MTYVAAFDIGTTAIKGLLINSEAEVRGKISIPLHTIHGSQGEIEQNPEEWWAGVRQIAHYWWENERIEAHEVQMISFSGQMEDVIPIMFTGEQPNAILYSDTRAKVEAETLRTVFAEHRTITGNSISPSTPLAKMMWLKQNLNHMYSDTKCFLFSSKDYIIYKLTDSMVSDPVTCATTGMMDIRKKEWHGELLNQLDIPREILPDLLYPEKAAGTVGSQASQETGFLEGTQVLCGSGDAGATTLGAAAVRNGDSYVYLGTTGWVAAATEEPEWNHNGIFNLVHMQRDTYISIAPLLNVGNIHQWGVKTFVDVNTTDDPFASFEEMVKGSKPGANGLLFLPYLHGERSYIQDEEAKGAFWGVHPKTDKNDFARAVLEGLCFSLKQTLEVLNRDNEGSITLIGGGTKSSEWCQCLADILGKTVSVPIDSEYLPAIGVASSAFITLGWAISYESFVDSHIKVIGTKTYYPSSLDIERYQDLYEKFLRLYPNLKHVYG